MMWGVVVGRFQPFHLGHLEYVEAAKAGCDRLLIGITNPDRGRVNHANSDSSRSQHSSNPFSYFERESMIEASLLGAGWNYNDFRISALPLDEPELLVAYLPTPEKATIFVTIYDEWGVEKAELLGKAAGHQVDVLWTRNTDDRLTSGTEIRSLLEKDAPWEHLVCSEAAPLISTAWREAGYAESK